MPTVAAKFYGSRVQNITWRQKGQCNTEAGDTFTFAEMSGWLREAGYVNPRLLDLQTVSPTVLEDKPR